MDRNFVVIGGGISGIAAAHYLIQAGQQALLLESASSLGGRIIPGMIVGEVLDLGGKNIGRHYTNFRELAAAYQSGGYQCNDINTARVINGKMRRIDTRHRMRSLLELLGPIGAVQAARLLPYALRAARNEPDGYLSSQYFSRVAAKKDDRPLSEQFSRTVCDRMLRSMLIISNGAEPDESYLGSLGTNLHMLFDSYDQLTEGMSPLLRNFQQSREVRLNTRAVRLATQDGRLTGVCVATGAGDDGTREVTVPCTDAVVALPAAQAAALIGPVLPGTAELLLRIPYFSVAVAVARYAHPVFTPGQRALLFGPGSPVGHAGAYSASKLGTVRYTFSGRAARPYIQEMRTSPPAQRDSLQARLLDIAETELGRYFRVSASDRIDAGWKMFDAGLCAYGPRQSQRVAQLHGELAKLTGLHVTGDYIEGASIEACCRAARSAVRAALA